MDTALPQMPRQLPSQRFWSRKPSSETLISSSEARLRSSVARDMLNALAIAGRLHARRLATTAASIHPISIVLRAIPPSSPDLKTLEVEFDNGERFIYSAEFLRVKSPAADSQRRSARGTARVVAGRRHVAIMSVEPIGNYAIRISFDDLHDTGIYTWSYLHSLGKNKFHLMREYIKSLRQQSLSREAPHKKPTVERELP